MRKIVLFILLVCVVVSAKEDQSIYEESWLFGTRLEAYKPTYFIPASYYDKPPKSRIDGTTFKQLEVEVQFSIKYEVFKDLLGWNGKYYLAYTHHSFWQLYAKSKPFRENIYNPEFFVRYPVRGLENFHLTNFQCGYEHKSNGQYDTTGVRINNHPIGNLSRGIDMLYGMFRFSGETWRADFKFWAPITSLNDNQNLMDYMGYTSLKIQYEYQRQIVTATIEGNIAYKKGSVELSYGYPIGRSVNLYIKGFSGYVDTLIDYQEHVNKIGVGFSFSR